VIEYIKLKTKGDEEWRRYQEMLQRVPVGEKGCTEWYSEQSEFWRQNRIKPWSCIPTA